MFLPSIHHPTNALCDTPFMVIMNGVLQNAFVGCYIERRF